MIQSKYRNIWDSEKGYQVYTKDDSEYATFLKNIESNIYSEQYPKFPSKETKNEPRKIPVSFDISRRREKFRDSYENKMKEISQALLQEKQKERVLKRNEGDVIKQKYNLKKERNQFETEISSKKFEEDSKLAQSAEEFEAEKKKFFCEKSHTARSRMFVSKNAHVDKMGKTRRSTVNVSKLTREYDLKKKELDTNANNIVKLMEDYEKKLSREENRNKLLQRELEEIASALHMEMLKLKSQEKQLDEDIQKQKSEKENEDKSWRDKFTEFLNQTDGSIKISEQKKKSLDQEMDKMKHDHNFKSCAYGGSLNNIRNKLSESETKQKSLTEQAEILKLLMKKAASDNKIEEANTKKTSIVLHKKAEVADENKKREDKSLGILKDSQILIEAKNEADRCAHLKNTVRYDKEMEQKIFKNMTDASKDIKERSIEISKLKASLEAIETKNSAVLLNQMRTAKTEEDRLKMELARQNTQIHELKIQRDMHFNDLVTQRKILSSDEKELGTSLVTHKRLESITEKSSARNNNDSSRRHEPNQTTFPSLMAYQ